jgi:hypothetical protein
MGFFSKTCSVSHLPVLADALGIMELSEVVALLPGGKQYVGIYDGYGRIDGHSLCEADEFETAKFVLKKFWTNQRFEDIGPSHREPGQGFFHDRELLKQWLAQGGFPSHDEYSTAYYAED